MLVQIFDFKEGILYMFEKGRQFQQMLEYFKEINAYTGMLIMGVYCLNSLLRHTEIIDICKKYGNTERNLWVEALSYFGTNNHPCFNIRNISIPQLPKRTTASCKSRKCCSTLMARIFCRH